MHHLIARPKGLAAPFYNSIAPTAAAPITTANPVVTLAPSLAPPVAAIAAAALALADD